MEMTVGNLVVTFLGTAMLWVGWFGFNAGSALGANGGAAMAMTVTQIAAAAAGFAAAAALAVAAASINSCGFGRCHGTICPRSSR